MRAQTEADAAEQAPVELLRRYADVVTRVALNLRSGQFLTIAASVDHRPIVHAVAESAFAAGASFVDVRYIDRQIERSHLLAGPVETLSFTPPDRLRWLEHLIESDGAYLQIHGEPDAALFAGIDGDRVARSRPIDLYRDYLAAVRRRAFAWTIVGGPNDGWSERVFGEPNLPALWRAVAHTMRLDAEDPVAVWNAHFDRLDVRARQLEEASFAALLFTGPGTDLRVGLHPGGRWLTARTTTAGGSPHIVNLPSEEVYTSPDFRMVDGTVSATRPLVVSGTTVEGLSVDFRGGQIVTVRAESGREMIEAELRVDPRARFAGEIALVDGQSRVGELDLTFRETLFDENAASHIAYGAGFTAALPGFDAMTADEQIANGLNVASIHRDFMIGGPDVRVDGRYSWGTTIPILVEGQWVLH